MDESCTSSAATDALARALAVQRDAARVGFDWPEISPVFEKVLEEVGEIREALASGNAEHAKDELGDLLFAVVNLSRFLDAEPSEALHRTTDRFERVCALVRDAGKSPEACTLEELDAAWEQAKRESLSACG